jgi:hypothetical protein
LKRESTLSLFSCRPSRLWKLVSFPVSVITLLETQPVPVSSARFWNEIMEKSEEPTPTTTSAVVGDVSPPRSVSPGKQGKEKEEEPPRRQEPSRSGQRSVEEILETISPQEMISLVSALYEAHRARRAKAEPTIVKSEDSSSTDEEERQAMEGIDWSNPAGQPTTADAPPSQSSTSTRLAAASSIVDSASTTLSSSTSTSRLISGSDSMPTLSPATSTHDSAGRPPLGTAESSSWLPMSTNRSYSLPMSPSTASFYGARPAKALRSTDTSEVTRPVGRAP